jgi:S-adenosylmethionine-diacylgycerolhomoserine-N-methlytransferase
MIPPWQAAIAAAFRAVAPGGALYIVDFGGQNGLPAWFRSGLRAWLSKFSVDPRAALETELQGVASTSGSTLHMKSLFRDYAHLAVIEKPCSSGAGDHEKREGR